MACLFFYKYMPEICCNLLNQMHGGQRVRVRHQRPRRRKRQAKENWSCASAETRALSLRGVNQICNGGDTRAAAQIQGQRRY
jgi:hypothetical protein